MFGLSMFDSLLFHPTTAPALWRAWSHAGAQPARRDFELDVIDTQDGQAPARWSEQPLSPFAVLSQVERADAPPSRQVLLVPPLAGGFPFILRDVAATMARAARVAVVEWINARFAPSREGAFDFDDQVAVIVEALDRLGPETHLMALCQAGPAALIAAAAAQAAPRSVSLIAAPIDPAAAPSAMSKQICARGLAFYQGQLTPRLTPDGGQRLVYPAESQMALLIATLGAQSPERDEFSRMILESVEATSRGEQDGPDFLERISSFMDLPGEFFVDSLERMYLAPTGPAGGFHWRGEPCDPARLEDTSLFVVEGSRDLVASPGQGRPALTLAPSGGRALRRARLERGAGHFGLFNGRRWRESVSPWLEDALDEVEALA